MNKTCKFLCAAAAIAALVPYRHTLDIASGESSLQALLWRARRIPKDNGEVHYDITLGLNLPGQRDREEDLYDDDALLTGGDE